MHTNIRLHSLVYFIRATCSGIILYTMYFVQLTSGLAGKIPRDSPPVETFTNGILNFDQRKSSLILFFKFLIGETDC